MRRCSNGYRIFLSVLEHNHPIDPVAAQYEPAGRRLDSDEVATILPWLENDTPSTSICQFIRKQLGKKVSTKDVNNMRAKVKAEYNTTGFLTDLATNLNANGRCCCTVNEDSYVTHFMYMSPELITYCRRYPEFLGIDATYGVCANNYNLFQIVVVDALRMAVPVFFGFLAQETTEAIGHMLRQFQLFVGPVSIRTIMTDDSAALQAAISTELPNARHLLCRVHILRNLKDRVSIDLILIISLQHVSSTFLSKFQIAMRTRNRWRYIVALIQLNALNPGLYESYVQPRLIARSRKWANCRIPATPAFGIRDNNFVEATHNSVKRLNISRRSNFWQAILKVRASCEHILINRQVKYTHAFKEKPSVEGRPELDPLCARLVPYAVKQLNNSCSQAGTMSYVLSGAHYHVFEGTRQYRIHAIRWECTCWFSAEFLLPCRHVIHVCLDIGGELGRFIISPVTL